MARPQRRDIVCPVELTFNLVGGRWKAMIMWHLLENEKLRFGELQRIVSEGAHEDAPKISSRILSKQLTELEEDGLICRVSYPEKIPRVEYTPTEKGISLKEILLLSYQWGLTERAQLSG